MKKRYLIIFLLLLSGISFLGFKFANKYETKTILKSPSIEGTYELTARKLPDGTMLIPPMVMGIQTFTKDIRNFSVMWEDKNGKHFTYTVYSKYKLTDNDYTESIIYGILNDEISGKGISYLTNKEKTVPIKYDNGKLEFQFPFDPPSVTFDGDRMIATSEGEFTDYWKKVE